MKIAVVRTIKGIDYFWYRQVWDLAKQLKNMLTSELITQEEHDFYLNKYKVECEL